MKKSYYSVLGSLLLLSTFSSCIQDKCTETFVYQVYEARARPVAELRALEPEAETPRDVCTPGNIYVYGPYLMIAEVEEGLHILNNADPANPINLGFLPVPGLTNMAVRNNILYVNSYMDLLTFQLDNPEQPQFLNRLEGVFQSYTFIQDQSGEDRVVIDYVATNETITSDCDQQFWRDWGWGWVIDECFNCGTFNVAVPFQAGVNADAAGGAGRQADGGAGIGGSLARFTISNANLYVVGDYNLQVFDLIDPTNPDLAGDIELGSWGIETIIPYEDHLFIGSQNGMYIFNNEEPLAPYQVGYYEHTRACDPVYVAGDRAYVTLRDGNECQGFINQLDVVDITDYTEPNLLVSHPMEHPIGLSVDENELFLCDDYAGLKVFDRSDDLAIPDRLLGRYEGITAQDIITLKQDKVAIVVGPDGIIQLDYRNVDRLRELSRIPICR